MNINHETEGMKTNVNAMVERIKKDTKTEGGITAKQTQSTYAMVWNLHFHAEVMATAVKRLEEHLKYLYQNCQD